MAYKNPRHTLKKKDRDLHLKRCESHKRQIQKTREITAKIDHALDDGQSTIHQIAKTTKLSWATVNRYIEAFAPLQKKLQSNSGRLRDKARTTLSDLLTSENEHVQLKACAIVLRHEKEKEVQAREITAVFVTHEEPVREKSIEVPLIEEKTSDKKKKTSQEHLEKLLNQLHPPGKTDA